MNPLNLLSILRAQQIHYHLLHWLASGENFQSDHKLFKDIYSALDKDIDSLAELMVGSFGPQSLVEDDLIAGINYCLKRWNVSNLSIKFLTPELDFESATKELYDKLKLTNHLTLAWDGFLTDTAKKHAKNIYKLKQRLN